MISIGDTVWYLAQHYGDRKAIRCGVVVGFTKDNEYVHIRLSDASARIQFVNIERLTLGPPPETRRKLVGNTQPRKPLNFGISDLVK